MNTEQFREHGKNMVEYICDYMDNVGDRNVGPTLDPGYLKKLIPSEAPVKGEDFQHIIADVESKIMPGVLHWNHPNFFAYFPSGNSYPSILGDMLSSALGTIGFSWASAPAATELETIVMDWYAKALDLPSFFVSDAPGSIGGGALQGSASECALVCLMTARDRAIKELKAKHNEDTHESVFLPRLVAYSSKEAHSSVEKAAKMALVKLRILDTDARGRFRGDTLNEAIEKDVANGMTPFFVVATVGTTGACAFDNLVEIGQVCKKTPSIWLHVDGAYAGNSFLLPEMRHFKKGMEYADSFNTNPNKLMLVNFDSSAMWVKDVMALKTALSVNPLYLQHEHGSSIDYRHYGIPLSRRFRALKLWFVFRSYGIEGLQRYIRNHIALAKRFEGLVNKDDRFEVRNDVHLGLVCFRLKNSDSVNREFLARINHSEKYHMIPSMVDGKYVIRFCVTYEHATEEHIDSAWSGIRQFADDVLESQSPSNSVPLPPLQIVKKAKPVLTRTMSSRFSFTRSVSREIYERQNSRGCLTDGCTPIIVLDTNEILESLQRAANKNNGTAAAASELELNKPDEEPSFAESKEKSV